MTTDKKPLLTRLVTWLRDRLGFEVTELGEDKEDHVPRTCSSGCTAAHVVRGCPVHDGRKP